ncbi:MAG: polymerase subunit delta [Actinomycetota bacterium]|jgi:DNA polymerase-3 subunit delta'|nr:polymerase subunit delta [Actinomycetota bacterium]
MSVWDPVRGPRPIDVVERQIAEGGTHAWLLLGPPGSGKRRVAVAMAAALNCKVDPGIGCGECSTCLRILRQRYPDVHHISAEGTFILVDQIRESVLAEAVRSPFEGITKVFIIEESDRMNPTAQNALLKTLEEPEAATVFILISNREEELLDTVRSRCRMVRLEPLSEERAIELLVAEGVPGDRALLVARLSEGDIALARAYAFDEEVWERRRIWLGIPRRLTDPLETLDAAAEIVAEAREAAKAQEALQKKEVAELAEMMGEGRGSAGARTALAKRHKRELRRLEESVLGEALVTLAGFYRDALAARRGAEGVSNLDILEDLHWWAAADIPDASFVAAVDRCVAARAALNKNANVALTIERALLDLMQLAPAEARVGATET